MTKQSYFDMCEELQVEPLLEEIPVEIEDFPPLVQQSFLLYNLLEDRWDTMGGGYLGKNYTIIFQLFELHEILAEEQLLVLQFLQCMDAIRQKIVSDKIKQKSPPTK